MLLAVLQIDVAHVVGVVVTVGGIISVSFVVVAAIACDNECSNTSSHSCCNNNTSSSCCCVRCFQCWPQFLLATIAALAKVGALSTSCRNMSCVVGIHVLAVLALSFSIAAALAIVVVRAVVVVAAVAAIPVASK